MVLFLEDQESPAFPENKNRNLSQRRNRSLQQKRRQSSNNADHSSAAQYLNKEPQMMYYVSGAPTHSTSQLMKVEDETTEHQPNARDCESYVFTPIHLPNLAKDIHLQCNQVCLSSDANQRKQTHLMSSSVQNKSKRNNHHSLDETICYSGKPQLNDRQSVLPVVHSHDVEFIGSTHDAVVYQRNFTDLNPFVVDIESKVLSSSDPTVAKEESFSNLRSIDEKLSSI